MIVVTRPAPVCELLLAGSAPAGAILMPSPRRKLEAARKAASAHEAASLPMTVVSLSVKNAAAAAAPSTSKDSVPEVNTAKASAQYYRDALTRTLTELGWRQATGFPSPRCAVVLGYGIGVGALSRWAPMVRGTIAQSSP